MERRWLAVQFRRLRPDPTQAGVPLCGKLEEFEYYALNTMDAIFQLTRWASRNSIPIAVCHPYKAKESPCPPTTSNSPAPPTGQPSEPTG